MQGGGEGSKPSKRQTVICVSLVQVVPKVGKIKYFKAKKEKKITVKWVRCLYLHFSNSHGLCSLQLLLGQLIKEKKKVGGGEETTYQLV